MNISNSMALTMAGTPTPPSRASSLRTPGSQVTRPNSMCSKDFALYTGVSNRALGWKQRNRNSTANPILEASVRDMSIRKWDGAARRSVEWDGLRRDPELWYPDGNCLVHLYGRGQSRRGPAFRVPMEALISTGCRPLLDRFLSETLEESPMSDFSEDEYFFQHDKLYELYIPAPVTAERGQAFLYHTATRNFFAWVFGRSLVGNHLGGALVGLLNSMTEFRSPGEDNVQGIMDYMDEEGYADMRNQPDHALAILFFSEHFHFRDLWMDAFAHCTGMNERLISSAGFEYMGRTSRALVTRSRFEMDMRLDQCGKRLSFFLSDDLSEAHLGLSPGGRAHLDKFRSFLQSYYIAKLGYYPPRSEEGSSAFPKHIYSQMCTEFQKLYEFLADPTVLSTDSSAPPSQQGGICVWQTVKAFDQRHKYQPLENPLPLLPEEVDTKSSRPAFNKRFSFAPRFDKMKPDPRLVSFSSLSKATNLKDQSLLECTLVRAYRGFEKDCIFSPTKADRNEKISLTEARKIRWILVYSILQILNSATKVPEEVRDTQNVSYSLCVLTAGCPPWKEERPLETLIRSQTAQTKEDFVASIKPKEESTPATPNEIKPDIDYFAITHKAHRRDISDSSTSSSATTSSRKSTVRRALSTLGNMPELRHPKPRRTSYHEILVHGYGNGTNTVITASRKSLEAEDAIPARKMSSESSSSLEELSSRWSNTSVEAGDLASPTTSLSSSNDSRRGSDSSIVSKASIKEFLDRPMSAIGLTRTSSCYSVSIYEDSVPHKQLQPDPLRVSRGNDLFMQITKEVRVEWESENEGNDELRAYLSA